MRRKGAILLSLTAAAMGIGVCAWAVRLPKNRRLATELTADSRAPTNRDVGVGGMGMENATVRERAVQALSQASAGDNEHEVTVSERRAEAQRQKKQHMQEVAAAFENEPTDRGWSRSKKSAVRSAMRDDALIANAVRSVECRSHTCRLEISDDSSGKITTGLPMFLMRLEPELPNMQADHTDDGHGGSATYILYLTEAQVASASAGR